MIFRTISFVQNKSSPFSPSFRFFSLFTQRIHTELFSQHSQRSLVFFFDDDEVTEDDDDEVTEDDDDNDDRDSEHSTLFQSFDMEASLFSVSGDLFGHFDRRTRYFEHLCRLYHRRDQYWADQGVVGSIPFPSPNRSSTVFTRVPTELDASLVDRLR